MVYPIMLNIKNKKCVVIGGGAIATRKANTLIQAGANVTVISPAITNLIESWSSQGLITYKQKSYSTDDIKDAFLIIAATNNRIINEQISLDATDQQLLNVIDDPEKGNFTVPSSLKRGKLLLTISTSGASPALARKIKGELAAFYDESYESYIEFLQECREHVKNNIGNQTVREKIFKGLLDPIFLDLTKMGNHDQRKIEFLQLIEKSKIGQK